MSSTTIQRVVVDHVSRQFGYEEEAVLAIDDVSLSAAPGEFVSLLGPSGCGKSSLLKIIDGLDRASAGRVLVNDKEVTGPRTDVGFVFQNDSLLPWRTVRSNILMGAEFTGSDMRAARQEADELLRLTGLQQFADRYPHQLSGGMRQRANLARALLVDPEILLMDEPFGALDAQTRELMQAELLRIWELRKKTVLFVTHQIEEAVYLSDRVLLMSARPGRIAAEYVIDLPRPRQLEIRHTDEFTAQVHVIWERLRDEVLETFRAETQAQAQEAVA
ncbi:ABC transporter ATP-binding protein [Conexibacter sp. CPCC 206217]|uniref:ABC transporter ATP-binding protein n=1 Tax=Conexibacter sp. CPCC 206217 TaxID=3064574 RepID=UPI002722AC65|nr:ABC transporter ATP-binding protein [Conexibacter sp. CPCC 206217]MDO8208893.1 ABC transporter ATP-binding protein [Conexibacter sp. CPCC 206217]